MLKRIKSMFGWGYIKKEWPLRIRLVITKNLEWQKSANNNIKRVSFKV